MAVALIADAHLGGPGGPAEPLVEQLLALPEQNCQRLVLMGDLFQAWIGDGRYETPEITAVVEVLRRLRDAGLPADYIEGNRDFFLRTSPWADAFRTITTELSFEVDGVRYLAVHGDGLDRRDWQYRFWRRVSKSAPSRFLMGRVPRRFARHLVRSADERLSQTNQRHKRDIPRQVICRYAEERLAGHSHDVLLLGHFHEERRWEVEGGRVWLLDAWFHSRRVEWLGEDAPAEPGPPGPARD